MEQDRLPSGYDPEVFERVWRRVMPEDRPDCPFTLPQREEAPAVPALPAVAAAPAPVPVQIQPSPAPEEHGVSCLGPASAVHGPQLQQYIDHELSSWRHFQHLARRAQSGGKVLATIAADDRRHAKRLSTAYFLISGVRYWPAEKIPAPSPTPLHPALRDRFWQKQQAAATYQTAAADTADPCLRELFLELAGDEDAHAWLIRGVLEQM